MCRILYSILNVLLRKVSDMKKVLWNVIIVIAGVVLLSGGCSDSEDEENRAPSISPVSPVTVMEGERVTLEPQVNDPDGDTLTLSFSGWMDTNTRLATYADIGVHTVTVTVTDPDGASASTEAEITVTQDTNPNRACFGYDSSQWNVPFPSDVFTVEDTDMVTGRRVSLPLPDISLVSEREDTEAVNRLDGFSTFPRITVPFVGAVPDADTFTNDTIILIKAGGSGRGTVVSVDQRLIDDTHAGSPRLIFAPDMVLRESTTYALAVLKSLTADGGEVKRPQELNDLLRRKDDGQGPADYYEGAVYDAVDTLESYTSAAADDILTISVFTTRTFSDIPVKLKNRVESGEFSAAAPGFDCDGIPGPEVFAAGDIQSITVYLHRAVQVSGGAGTVSYPAGSLIQSVGLADWDQDVYIKNRSDGSIIQVPADNLNTDGSVSETDISLLSPEAGDNLDLLVASEQFSSARLPFGWNSCVDKIVFGWFDAPRYYSDDMLIPTVKTNPEYVPAQTDVHRIVFIMFIPVGTKPSGGWPVAYYSHGGDGSFIDGGTFNGGPVMASRGTAMAAFSAPGHGGGPESYITVTTGSGDTQIPGVGRQIDYDNDQRIADDDHRRDHQLMQRVSDFCTLIRSMQEGADYDGDADMDITRDPEYTYLFGISFGGRTTTVMASIEDRASFFAANVPGAGGKWVNYGYFPRIANRSLIDLFLSRRVPILNNGASPEYGGTFDEDIPLKDQPVQTGMVTGAEAIQRALDFALWKEQVDSTADYGCYVRTGELRGSPADYLVQIVRGDQQAVNPMQMRLILSGGLESASSIVRCDNEPQFDADFWYLGGAARHVMLALRYNGVSTGGKISHYARTQIADYFDSGGTLVTDPDGDDGSDAGFAGDVFQHPIPSSLIELMINDRGF